MSFHIEQGKEEIKQIPARMAGLREGQNSGGGRRVEKKRGSYKKSQERERVH